MSDPSQASRAELPDELKRVLVQLKPYFERSDIPVPPEAERGVPELQANMRVSEMAHALGQQLRGSGLYFAGAEPVTIDEETGEMQPMTHLRFVSWVEEFVSFYKFIRKEKEYVSISERRAAQVLKSDAFRAHIPKLSGVHPIKLPVRRRDGSVVLLRAGYDAQSGIYTLRGGPDYPEDMPHMEAATLLFDMLQFFPFSDGDRSRAVHLASMLSVFGAGLLPAGARAPMFIYNANQVGSGKTRLAQMGVIAVYGKCDAGTWGERAEEFQKELDSAAQAFAPYLFFDDKTGLLRSQALNRFATSGQLGGRVICTKERFSVPLRTVILITGNHLRYSDDIYRRSLICDLWARVQYDQRKLPAEAIDMTEEWLRAEVNRNRILAALWSLVKHAQELQAVRPAIIARKIGSFESWSETIPPILIHAGLGDPTEMPKVVEAQPHLADARNLARIALDELVGDRAVHPVRVAQLVPIARLNGLFPDKLGTLDDIIRDLDSGRGKWKPVQYVEPTLVGESYKHRDPDAAEKRQQAAEWTDRGMMTAFGIAIKKLMNGLEFSNSKGERYQFGMRGEDRHATYTCTRL
jgi:hypothetical protein